jgi:aldehyde dehydrogenase (NAD+)
MTDLAELFARHKAQVAGRRVSFDRAARLAALAALRQAVLDQQDQIIAALQSDFGKHPVETLLSEIMPVLQEIDHARRHLRGWMRGRRVWPGLTTLGASARVVPQARGVALIIAPWNYPVTLALGPLVSALAAGCSVIVKPSEMVPATSALLNTLIARTFPADLVAVAEGGVEVATELLALPFDHIFFTGSPEVGRVVMAAAARHLASVTLELGGKSPVIVGPDANIAQAARWIAWGRFFNGGQTCVAPDHVFVDQAIAPAFSVALKAEVARMWGQPGNLARVVNARHAARLRGLIADAAALGAQVTGGQGEGTTLTPTLLEGTTEAMAVSHQEIFGPVLPLIPYADLEAVLARIEAGPKPLALYVFGGKELADKVVAETTSGSVGVNLTVLTFSHPNLPFGGIGNSGLGAAHGHDGFRAFSHERAVMVNHFLPMRFLMPPYGARVRRLARLLLR